MPSQAGHSGHGPPCNQGHLWLSRGCGPCHFFFFFQAEDGIRDLTVTGVQTCALPISHETQGDRADHALDLDRRDRRRRGQCRSRDDEQHGYEQETEAGRSRGGSEAGANDDRPETVAAPLHFWSARRLTSSKRRLAASSAVIWPGPSDGGETSTTSAPTSACPASARTSTSASYEASPPTSGVPVPGANAGSTASMSNEQ